jgi:hypothetical protein
MRGCDATNSTLLMVLLVVALLVTMTIPAWAVGTVAYEGGGHMYTRVWAYTTAGQTHWRGLKQAGPYLQTYKRVYWGLHTGNRIWDVPDPTVNSETAPCPQ